ncbi:MAG: hypothetical protein JRN15_23500 [Nitrososphaerota archaeon]|nr:hypothetical protein [Nitrososphaerota archaeon]
MERDEQSRTIRRTLNRLLEEHFFLEPKPFGLIYDELVRPSLFSADILFDRKLVSDELHRLVRDGKLSMEGRLTDVVYFQVRN